MVAVFERCCYLTCPRGIVCIGEPSIGGGPINADVILPCGISWSSLGLAIGDEGHARGGRNPIGGALILDVESGFTWEPPPFPAFNAEAVAAGLRELHRAASQLPPPDGLSPLIIRWPAAPSPDHVQRAASEPVSRLRQALPHVLFSDQWNRNALRAATLLVGLGPGFTPSGDDVLGGLMLALSAAGRKELRDSLWLALEPELGDLTVPASAMHLSAAADGMACELVHNLINAMLLGETARLTVQLEAVIGIGHTSGWDIVAGLVMGLEGLTGVPIDRRP